MVTEFLRNTWSVVGEMAPYLLFGFFVAGVLSVMIRPETVEKHLGRKSIWTVFKAALLGVPLPLCSCGVIPVTASLRRSGATRAAATAFLLSTPQTGVDSILVTFSLLGPVFAVFRPLAALLTGFIGGSIVHHFVDDDRSSDAVPERPSPRDKAKKKLSLGERTRKALEYGFLTLPKDIGKPLLAGIVVAGLIASWIPDDYFTGLLGTGFLSMLAALALGIPMYVCATASVPIAAALVAKGIPPGAALVFLMTGPATNAASIITVWKIMGRFTTIVYLLTTAGCALASGLLLDRFFAATATEGITALSGVHDMLPLSVRTAAALLLLCILGLALFKSTGSKDGNQKDAEVLPMRIHLQIEGMTCSHCAGTVERALSQCEGVVKADVRLEQNEGFVEGEGIAPSDLIRAVESVGYKARVADE